MGKMETKALNVLFSCKCVGRALEKKFLQRVYDAQNMLRERCRSSVSRRIRAVFIKLVEAVGEAPSRAVHMILVTHVQRLVAETDA